MGWMVLAPIGVAMRHTADALRHVDNERVRNITFQSQNRRLIFKRYFTEVFIVAPNWMATTH